MAAPRARITTVGNLKGGSGKTTNAVNLGCALAHGVGGIEPQRVLFVDLEPLRTASRWLGVQTERAERSSAALFDSPGHDTPPEMRLEQLRALVQRAEAEPLDVIAAEPDGLEVVDGLRGKEYDLKDNLALLAAEYDHVFIDLPGSRMGRLIRSALVASDGVLVPVQPGSAAVESTMDFFALVEEIRRGANPQLQVDGLVISDAGPKGDADAELVYRSLQAALPYPVLRTRVRTLKATQRASAFRVSVFQMGDANATEDFTSLSREWIRHVTAGGAV